MRFLLVSLALVCAASLGWAGGGGGRSAPAAKSWTAKSTHFEHRTHGKSKVGWERRATGKSGITKIHGKLWGNKIKGESYVSSNGTQVEALRATSPSGDVRLTRTEKYRQPTSGKVVERKRILMPTHRQRKDIAVQEVDGRRYRKTTDTSISRRGTERIVVRDELQNTVVKLTRWVLGKSFQFDRREYDMSTGKLVQRARGKLSQRPGSEYDNNMNTALETPVP